MKAFFFNLIRKIYNLRRPAGKGNRRRLRETGKTPDGVIFREATEADIKKLATLHVRTWIDTYQGILIFGSHNAPTIEIRESQWRALFSKKDGSWFCYVAENEDGDLIGFAKGNIKIDNNKKMGELNKLYLDRIYQRMGLGSKLLLIVARRFLDQGITSMSAYVEPRNPSCFFFQNTGAEYLLDTNGKVNYNWFAWPDLNLLFKKNL